MRERGVLSISTCTPNTASLPFESPVRERGDLSNPAYVKKAQIQSEPIEISLHLTEAGLEVSPRSRTGDFKKKVAFRCRSKLKEPRAHARGISKSVVSVFASRERMAGNGGVLRAGAAQLAANHQQLTCCHFNSLEPKLAMSRRQLACSITLS